MADISFKKWQCGACIDFSKNAFAIMDSVNLAALGLASYGFIYDEEFGDEEEGFPPGTRFKDIDDNWLCPDCGTTKDMFVEVEK